MQRNTNVVAGFVSGLILDQTGQLLPGANVVLKGTRTRTQTDFDGKFTIQAPANSELEISYIGFESTQINVGRNNMVTIHLRESANRLQEVVTVGYETIKGDPDATLTIDEPVGRGTAVTVEEDNNVYKMAPQDNATPVVTELKDKKVGSEIIEVAEGTQRKRDLVGISAGSAEKIKMLYRI
ncbi:carboxypeptidase-like regulatory domain-containing protein [Flavobacterium sp. P21]|uniref:carboxypeptidase-like regulatory domain-containing protein n=1 Tax=Flavobacterium sp. P21 TaxID=3423948 RepID=UPI003D667758